MSNSVLVGTDLEYFNKLKNSSVFHLKIISKFEFVLFKNELINILKIEEKITPENDFKKELNQAVNHLVETMRISFENHPRTKKLNQI